MRHYMTKDNRAFEVIFSGDSIQSIKEIQPITRLGDLNRFEAWTKEKQLKAKQAFDILGI